MLSDNGGGICGIKVMKHDKEILSIISHKFSYGGKEGLFEIMTADDEVEGFLSENKIINILDTLTIEK